jgi:nitroreductase
MIPAHRSKEEVRMNETLKVIARRRSLRQFRPEQIAPAELEAILAAGLQAPTGHNDQSCFFAVVQNRDLIGEMSLGSKLEMQKIPVDWIVNAGKNEKYDVYYGAPTVLIVAARRNAVSPAADVCAAIQNVLIAAESLNIGSCWIGFAKFYFTNPERYQKLEIPDGYEVHYGVALGYKPDGFKANPPAKKFDRYFSRIV